MEESNCGADYICFETTKETIVLLSSNPNRISPNLSFTHKPEFQGS